MAQDKAPEVTYHRIDNLEDLSADEKMVLVRWQHEVSSALGYLLSKLHDIEGAAPLTEYALPFRFDCNYEGEVVIRVMRLGDCEEPVLTPGGEGVQVMLVDEYPEPETDIADKPQIKPVIIPISDGHAH